MEEKICSRSHCKTGLLAQLFLDVLLDKLTSVGKSSRSAGHHWDTHKEDGTAARCAKSDGGRGREDAWLSVAGEEPP